MSMIEPKPPTSMNEEEWLKFRAEAPAGQGNDVVVVSGYANYDDYENITGSPDDDATPLLYDCRLFVGPSWRQLNDVSPIAFIAGFVHFSSDEADVTGMRVTACTWDWVSGGQNPKRQVQLIVSLAVSGGEDAKVMSLGYHLTARGYLMPNQNFNEIT